MRKLIHICLIGLAAFLLMKCTDGGTSGGDEIAPLDFTTTPSEELSQIVEETPGDFTWGFYEDNISVGLDPEPSSFSGEIVLSVFKVRNGEVVNRLTTEPVGTSLEELAAGLSSEDMFPDSKWITQNDWFPPPTIGWSPSDTWYPGSMWAPSEIESIAISENNLAEDERLIVVYPELAEESADREQVSQPYGIVFQNQEPQTGTLRVITTTDENGADNSYTFSVDGGTSQSIAANDTVNVTGLQEGSHDVGLAEIPDRCTLSGTNPRSESITAGSTTETIFEVQCEAPKSMIERFAGESSSVRVVNAEAFQVRPGGLPFLHVDNPYGTSPDNLMLIIPESASADGTLELSEMMGIVFADAEKQPLELNEAYPGSQWYRFSGDEFYPGSQWISDQAQYPGSQWTPESLADMEIAFVNGAQSMTELFGDVDFSENSENTDTSIQSEKKLGIAARADLLFGMNVTINQDLDQVLNQPAENLNFISGAVNTGGILIPENLETGADIGNKAVWSIPGDAFYPGSMWTPENVSAFTAPVSNIFASDFSPYPFETQLLLVGGDVFGSAPERFNLVEAGQTIDGLSNYRMMVAGSVLDIELGLYPTANQKTQTSYLRLIQSTDGTFFPEGFYHPVDFTFPDGFQTGGARYDYLPLEPSFEASAVSEHGITVGLNN